MSNTEALRAAAKAALECLESLQGGCTDSSDGTVEAITVWCPEVIDALRAALAQPAASGEPAELTPEEIEFIAKEAGLCCDKGNWFSPAGDPDDEFDVSSEDLARFANLVFAHATAQPAFAPAAPVVERANAATHVVERETADVSDNAQPAPALVPLPARLVRFTLRDLKAKRKRLDGFVSLGNELARAAEYDEWIAALEAYCAAHGIGTPAKEAL